MQIIIDNKVDILNEQKFYYTKRLKDLYKLLLIKMMQPKNKTKIQGVLITGKPDAGKTTGINQFKIVYTASVDNGYKTDIFYFNVPPRLHAKGVFHKLCQELKIPDIQRDSGKHTSIYYLDKSARKIGDRYKALFIDEMQNLFLLSSENRKEILELFNRLINEARIPIFLVGVDGVNDILYDLDQDVANLKGTFSSRFPEFKIQNFSDINDKEFITLLVSINNDFDLKDTANNWYKDKIIRQEIVDLTNGLVGKIVELLRYTIIKIIDQGLEENITRSIIKETATELGYLVQ